MNTTTTEECAGCGSIPLFAGQAWPGGLCPSCSTAAVTGRVSPSVEGEFVTVGEV